MMMFLSMIKQTQYASYQWGFPVLLFQAATSLPKKAFDSKFLITKSFNTF